MENYSDFSAAQLNAGKHVTLLSELSRLVDSRTLMQVKISLILKSLSGVIHCFVHVNVVPVFALVVVVLTSSRMLHWCWLAHSAGVHSTSHCCCILLQKHCGCISSGPVCDTLVACHDHRWPQMLL